MNQINTTINEMGNFTQDMPMAYEYPVYDGDNKVIENFKSVITDRMIAKNKANKTNRMLAMPTNNYSVVQHSFVLEKISHALNALKLDGKVAIDIKENGAVMHGYVIFDKKVIQDDAKGIQVGFRFTNSYDGKSSISFTTHGLRLVCSNGMMMRSLGVRELISHVGSKDFEERIQIAIKNIIANDAKMQALIDHVIPQKLSWKQSQEIFVDMIQKRRLGFKAMSKILAKIGVSAMQVIDKKSSKKKLMFVKEKDYSNSKWDLYNAITNYLTHEHKGFVTKDWFEKAAEDLLTVEVEA